MLFDVILCPRFYGGWRLVSPYITTLRVLVSCQAGLTQRELAERIGREQSFIGRIETRQRRVDLVEFVWIARCCGFDGEKELAKVTKRVLGLIPQKPTTK